MEQLPIGEPSRVTMAWIVYAMKWFNHEILMPKRSVFRVVYLIFLKQIIDVTHGYSLTQDTSVIKMAAISGRGRKRDFFDLYFLLHQFKLEELFSFYNLTYHDGSELQIARSLTYFEYANEDEDPVLLKPADWSYVKDTIREEVKKLYSVYR
jgi:hypothetical protein